MNANQKAFILWVDQLQDPDDVGQAEYRALHENLTEINAAFEDDPFALADGILTEFVEWATVLKKQIQTVKGNITS